MAVRVYRSDVGDIGDTTDELKSIAAARSVRHVVLGIVALGGLVFAAGLTIRPPQSGTRVPPEVSAAIDGEVQRLAKIVAATATSARGQAETMSVKTQVRAGILTDAATVKDLVTSEIELPRNLSQTLELVQLHGKDRTVLLNLPEGSPAIPPIAPGTSRLAIDGRKEVAVVTAVAVKPVDPSSEITGELVLSTPLDFTLTREALAIHAT